MRVSLAVLTLVLLTAVSTCRWDEDGRAGGTVQGWTASERTAWYWGTQGSRLMPMAWFTALEQASGEAPFASMENLARFGFLTPPEDSPSTLPIGIAADQQADAAFPVTGIRWYDGQAGGDKTAETWVGLNCAACHTARMSYGETTLTIDGGPNLLDFQSFVEELDAAIAATKSDSAKWDRFATKVLGGKDTPENRAKLDLAYAELLAWQQKTAAMNATPLRYGFGRLDAVGHILNKILMFTGAPASAGNASNAPVSYPFLWGIANQDRVQWNGIARNSRFALPGDPFEYGALGRNTGEVLGVFGEVVIPPNTPTLTGYTSSVNSSSLDSMEQQLRDLQTPAWPAAFPAIDETLRAKGETLFAAHCAACHTEPVKGRANAATERMAPFETTAPVNLTDIWMACNAFVYAGPTGTLQGTKDINGNTIGTTSQVATLLATTVRGALLGDKPSLVNIAFRNFLGLRELPEVDFAPEPGVRRSAESQICLTTKGVDTLAYKARPLDGIWATAPYLHNGSVASLYEILMPPAQRRDSFWVGNRTFDPVNVGYETTKPDAGGFLLVTTDAGGNPIPGNSHIGHDYGVGSLSADDRMALIEYMKSL